MGGVPSDPVWGRRFQVLWAKGVFELMFWMECP